VLKFQLSVDHTATHDIVLLTVVQLFWTILSAINYTVYIIVKTWFPWLYIFVAGSMGIPLANLTQLAPKLSALCQLTRNESH